MLTNDDLPDPRLSYGKTVSTKEFLSRQRPAPSSAYNVSKTEWKSNYLNQGLQPNDPGKKSPGIAVIATRP